MPGEHQMPVANSSQTKQLNLIHTFVNSVRVYIEDHSMSMIDHVDWLCFK